MNSDDNAKVICENCTAENPPLTKFCTQCSFPILGNDEEKGKFRLIIGNKKQLLKDAKGKIQTSKYVLYGLAGFILVTGLYQGLANDDFNAMITNLFLSLIYLVLIAWSDKNPFAAILSGLIVYATIILINAFFQPSSLFSGILVKIFIIMAFVKGIQSANEAQKYLSELEKLKSIRSGE